MPQENEAVSAQSSEDMDRAENAAEEMQGYAASASGAAMAADSSESRESRAKTAYAMENVYAITVPDVHAFLAAAAQKTGIAWSEKQVGGSDTAADRGNDAVTLSLSEKEWNRLLQYANQCGYQAELIADYQNKSKILVTIAGEEG